MSDKNPLNGKYQSFDDEEINEVEAVENTYSKPKKEKKKKEPKPPKEKKTKEKKVKEPKPPKGKKVKEPKPPKEKKAKKSKAENNYAEFNDGNSSINEKFVKAYEEALNSNEEETALAEEVAVTEEIPQAEENTAENEVTGAEKVGFEEATVPEKNGRYVEEIVFKTENNDKKSKKAKKVKEPKPPKEKKVKEPKPAKEKKPKKDKKKREPLEKKDVITILAAILAVLLVSVTGFFAYFNSRPIERKMQIVAKISFLGKIFPQYVANPNENGTIENKFNLADIQIAREGVFVNLVPTDFPGVFYGINSDKNRTVQYYQYNKTGVVPVKYTDTVDLKVDMGSDVLNVKMNYIKSGEYISGISVFTADEGADTNYFYNFVVFKLTVLPLKYQKSGHALLLASTDKAALEGNNVLWTESFDVDLNTGTVTRFLSVINRNIDEKGAGVADFCILNEAGYKASTQNIPFITSREYPTNSGMQDIFVKNGNKEELLASNIYGKYFTADATTIAYLRKTETGFDVIHNVDGTERVQRSFYGFIGTAYMANGKYILSKEDGRLFDILSGKDYSLIGYSMDASAFTVSGDGRYVVMMGTVKNAVDYQIHIFDLQTGEYAKFKDGNYAPHGTLCFIDDKTVLYTAVEPNQGYEYVVLDVEKAFTLKK